MAEARGGGGGGGSGGVEGLQPCQWFTLLLKATRHSKSCCLHRWISLSARGPGRTAPKLKPPREAAGKGNRPVGARRVSCLLVDTRGGRGGRLTGLGGASLDGLGVDAQAHL